MSYPIQNKLVVGVSTNALFDLELEDHIFQNEGIEKYKQYQKANRKVLLEKGLAFPFIRRFLKINQIYPDEKPVEVVLLSKNSPETGLRIFSSIQQYGLEISRAAFTSGKSPYQYIPAYNISLFLSTNREDVNNAIQANYPAGFILKTAVQDDDKDSELRVAFDFDGVLADDSAEQVFQESGEVAAFNHHEEIHRNKPLKPGLLNDFFTKLSFFQKLENKKQEKDKTYKKILRTAIITARAAPAHERAVNTLKSWNVSVDEMFFQGGIEKKRILEIFKPHLFLDDQIGHLDQSLKDISLVHIPFGIINRNMIKSSF